MAAPQSGRVFLKTHQDCFIHGMAYLIQYWNFSLNQVSKDDNFMFLSFYICGARLIYCSVVCISYRRVLE